jgi:hypothetical protein
VSVNKFPLPILEVIWWGKPRPTNLADLTLKFKTRDIVEAIGDVNYGDILTLQLAGVLSGERPIEGAGKDEIEN